MILLVNSWSTSSSKERRDGNSDLWTSLKQASLCIAFHAWRNPLYLTHLLRNGITSVRTSDVQDVSGRRVAAFFFVPSALSIACMRGYMQRCLFFVPSALSIACMRGYMQRLHVRPTRCYCTCSAHLATHSCYCCHRALLLLLLLCAAAAAIAPVRVSLLRLAACCRCCCALSRCRAWPRAAPAANSSSIWSTRHFKKYIITKNVNCIIQYQNINIGTL